MNEREVREQLIDMLTAPNAHLTFEKAVEKFSVAHQGKKIAGFPHTAWQLLEHLRIAQWDILEFSRNPDHVSPDWPEGYWPKEETPPDEKAWNRSVAAFIKNLNEMAGLIEDPDNDLFEPFEYGDGQNLFREAYVLAKHNSYHIGQLMVLKKGLK